MLLIFVVMIVLFAAIVIVIALAGHQEEEAKEQRARDREETARAYFQCCADQHFEIMRGKLDSITATEWQKLLHDWDSMTKTERRKQLRDWGRMEEWKYALNSGRTNLLRYKDWQDREAEKRRAWRRIGKQFELYPRCPYCDKLMPEPDKTHHLDHIRPRSRGGPIDEPENLVFVCASCNLKKGDKTLWKFIEQQKLDREKIEGVLELLGKKPEYYTL